MTHTLQQLLGARYHLGGRDPHGAGVDCLAVVMVGVRQAGAELPDPWPAFLEQWRRDGELPQLPGFPPNWSRADGLSPRDGDVWLWSKNGPEWHQGCGVVNAGLVWSASPEAGVVALPISRARRPLEVWRP